MSAAGRCAVRVGSGAREVAWARVRVRVQGLAGIRRGAEGGMLTGTVVLVG
ncbi:Hypothetical protein CAP_4497 [Chondromyces apiculatus DSM 436]|uniref:Uncharacterized protein n=1 Tax=Chondromyces apiculatus DSM 436 TaxID=1192034 RepID=A0A017T5P7_9BACT|nr:Hypothetical protein CAP_4497 [Chondromyces apiculatus DSM 436]